MSDIDKLKAGVSSSAFSEGYRSVPKFGTHWTKITVSVTKACARRPGAAASVSRRRRERRTLLAGSGRRASRSHTLAASQAFERMHMLFCHRVKTSAHGGPGNAHSLRFAKVPKTAAVAADTTTTVQVACSGAVNPRPACSSLSRPTRLTASHNRHILVKHRHTDNQLTSQRTHNHPQTTGTSLAK